jgi:hypothetical protein
MIEVVLNDRLVRLSPCQLPSALFSELRAHGITQGKKIRVKCKCVHAHCYELHWTLVQRFRFCARSLGTAANGK